MQGVAVLGLSAVAGTTSGPDLLGSRLGSAGQASIGAGTGSQRKHLVLDYKPSQVTGWSPPYSPTHGGYAAAADFTQHGKSYRISLVPFGQKGSNPQPLYESVPTDPVIKFKETLNKEWGKYYTFRYQGGLPSGAWFTVESYGARASASPNKHQPEIGFGADLYAVYHPGAHRGGTTVNSDLQFIQMLYFQIGPGVGTGDNEDDTARANPFAGEGGGLTSINGNESVSFFDSPSQINKKDPLPPYLFMAETFLVQDTRTKDKAGKDIVNVFGGVKWGWQMKRLG
jgi:hypothetical protein